MRKKYLIVVAIALALLIIAGCAAHVHQVGKGAQGTQIIENRQWYALFGLVPLNKVDTGTIAAGATDYTIKTESSALDIIMNIFTSYVTVNSRTVTVTK